MKRTHISLPEPVIEELKEMSEKRDISVSELIRLAVAEFLKYQANS